MTEQGQDRRAQRTQQALINALIELLAARHYDQITIQDIVDQANVGRATFYAHYQNKDDLLKSGFERILDILVQQIVSSEKDQCLFDTSMLFHHAQGHYELYRTLVWGSGFELLTKEGHAALSKKIEDRFALLLTGRQPPSIPLPILSSSVAGALLILLKWWLDNKLPYSPERMDEIFQQLVMPGVRTVLGLTEIAEI
ncbi:MAG: TetR/AcrR family transcriptional regulator [Chloroflexota bacterium]